MDVFLQTERLRLRRFTPADVENLVELDGDPEVMRYLTNGRPTPREVVEGEVLPAILNCYERGGAGRWAVEETDGGGFLGWLSLQPPAGRRHGGTRPRLPAAPIGVGPRIRRRGRPGAGARGVRHVRRRAGVRPDHGRQHPFPAGDGEGRPAVSAHLPPGVGRSRSGHRARRGRVRTPVAPSGSRAKRTGDARMRAPPCQDSYAVTGCSSR